MLQKILTISLMLSSAFAISCSSLSDIDKPMCVEHSMIEGHCIDIISGKKYLVNETNKIPFTDSKGKVIMSTWYELRPYFILVPPDTMAALKKYLINQCKKSNSCDQKIDSWDRTISELVPEELKAPATITP